MNVAPQLPDDLSRLTREELRDVAAENRAWGRRLREATTALVNARLSKSISQQEYSAQRQAAIQEAAEYMRRAELLSHF